jgi:hypothetical protein
VPENRYANTASTMADRLAESYMRRIAGEQFLIMLLGVQIL